jgi:hypothetical protein
MAADNGAVSVRPAAAPAPGLRNGADFNRGRIETARKPSARGPSGVSFLAFVAMKVISPPGSPGGDQSIQPK